MTRAVHTLNALQPIRLWRGNRTCMLCRSTFCFTMHFYHRSYRYSISRYIYIGGIHSRVLYEGVTDWEVCPTATPRVVHPMLFRTSLPRCPQLVPVFPTMLTAPPSTQLPTHVPKADFKPEVILYPKPPPQRLTSYQAVGFFSFNKSFFSPPALPFPQCSSALTC